MTSASATPFGGKGPVAAGQNQLSAGRQRGSHLFCRGQQARADDHVAAKPGAQLGDGCPRRTAARGDDQDRHWCGQEGIAYLQQRVEVES